jgi:hypothetical protein
MIDVRCTPDIPKQANQIVGPPGGIQKKRGGRNAERSHRSQLLMSMNFSVIRTFFVTGSWFVLGCGHETTWTQKRGQSADVPDS